MGEQITKGQEEAFGVMDIFFFFFVVMVLWVYTYIKANHIVSLIMNSLYVNYTLIKMFFKSMVSTEEQTLKYGWSGK